MTHTFELSGLGKAPFKIVSTDHGQKNGVFFCEHCGTVIKNRNFVKSADGIISVIGIDCLNKTDDAGLIDGAKRLKKAIKNEEKMARFEQERLANIEREKANNGGKTNAELAEEMKLELDAKMDDYIAILHENAVISSLSFNEPFTRSMSQYAYAAEEVSQRSFDIIAEIVAKKRSGARKGSKGYNEALEVAKKEVAELQQIIRAQSIVKKEMEEKILYLRFN